MHLFFSRSGQQWRGLIPVMQAHENRYTKRAGVAGLRVRVKVLFIINVFCNDYFNANYSSAIECDLLVKKTSFIFF